MTDYAAAKDAQLIHQVRRGELDALGELYARYRHQVYRTALAVTRNPESAEDILQDVFLKFYRYIDHVDTSLSLMPWLYRITVNLCYTRISRQKRWLTALEDVIDNMVAPPAQTSPEHRMERSEANNVIQEAIDALSPNQKIVVVLYYLADLSLKEIAYILEIPEGTVKSRLYYGRENLRQKLEQNRQLFPEVAYEFT